MHLSFIVIFNIFMCIRILKRLSTFRPDGTVHWIGLTVVTHNETKHYEQWLSPRFRIVTLFKPMYSILEII